MKSIPPVVALVAGHVAEEEGQPERHGGAADPAGGAPPDRGAVVGERQADDRRAAGRCRPPRGRGPGRSRRRPGRGSPRTRTGWRRRGARRGRASGRRAGTRRRAPARACRWWPGRAGRRPVSSNPPVVPKSPPVSMISPVVGSIDVAGGLERLGRVGAEEDDPNGSNGDSNTFSVSSSTVNQSAMSPEPEEERATLGRARSR